MKNNFRKLLFIILPLAAISLLLSCNKDDDNKQDRVVGTWKYIGYTENDVFTGDTDACYTEIASFQNNGNGQIAITDCEEGNESLTFSWNKEDGDNIYRISSDGDAGNVKILFADSDKRMTIYSEVDGTDGEVYTRQ